MRGRGCVGYGAPRGVGEQDLGEPGRAQLHEGVEEEREDVRSVEQVGAYHQVEGARGAHALQVRRVAPQQLRRHLRGQRRCQRRRAIGGLGGGWREQPGRWQGGQWVRLSPWECQAAQSHQARAEGDMASMLRRPSPAPSSALYASSISSWLGLGLGLGVGLGLG